jgi:hypothetical protein
MSNLRPLIACDIGGVVKNLYDDQPIDESIKTINWLCDAYDMIFISKCNDTYQLKITDWIRQYNLNHIKIYFCTSYDAKIEIATKLGVKFMIDDKMQVLNTFVKHDIKLLWFCNDTIKINGLKKFQPDLYDRFIIVKSWADVRGWIESL